MIEQLLVRRQEGSIVYCTTRGTDDGGAKGDRDIHRPRSDGLAQHGRVERPHTRNGAIVDTEIADTAFRAVPVGERQYPAQRCEGLRIGSLRRWRHVPRRIESTTA